MRSTHTHLLSGLFALLSAAALTGCPGGDEKVCTRQNTGCDGGEVAVGEYPDCRCVVHGTEDDEPPVIQGPEGMSGGGRLSLNAGWTLVGIDGELAGVAMVAHGVEGTTMGSAVFPAQAMPTPGGFAIELPQLEPDFGFVASAEADRHSLLSKWAGPVTVRAISPQGQLVVEELPLNNSLMPVKVEGQGADLLIRGRLDVGFGQISIELR